MENFRYRINFPESSEIMVAQSGQKAGTYKLVDIFLEFETILNKEFANKVRAEYVSGRQLWYDHIRRVNVTDWSKDSVRENLNVNISCKSMKAIVLLFTKRNPTDSEQFLNPKINKVSVTMDGVPNSVYSQGLTKSKIYEEARRYFGKTAGSCIENVDKLSFLKSKYALVVDLRTVNQQYVIHTGRKIGAKSGVVLAIEKSKMDADLTCHTFVIADGNVYFKDLKIVEDNITV